MGRRGYPPEFRRKVLDLIAAGRPVVDVARDLGISAQSIYTWLAGCRDYWSKYELGWHISPTANQHDAIAAVELALTEAEHLTGHPLLDLAERTSRAT